MSNNKTTYDEGKYSGASGSGMSNNKTSFLKRHMFAAGYTVGWCTALLGFIIGRLMA